MKPVKGWVVILNNIWVKIDTFRSLKKLSIQSYIERRPAHRKWKDEFAIGYRCIRVTLRED